MNYSALFKNFTKEVSRNSQYFYLDSPFKALAVVATLPFWILYGVLIAALYVYLFVFNCLASSADYLEGWVKETKKDVNHITEAVIYLATTPIIFLFRIMLSLFSIAFYLMWFITMCDAYIASLGGIRWQPFISNAKYDDGLELQPTTNDMAANIIVVIGFILFCLWVFFLIIGLIAEDFDIIEISNIISYIYSIYMVVAIPVTFRYALVSKDMKGNAPLKTVEEVKVVNDYEEEFPDF